MNELLKQVLGEANAKAAILREARSGEAHFSPKGVGAMGHMLILDDTNPMIGALAAALKVPDGWKLTAVGNIFAAYSSGDRLSFMMHKDDFVNESGDEDEDDK